MKGRFALPELEIPKEDVEGLATLREMPEESFNVFILGIERDDPIISDIPSVSPEDVKRAVATLKTMYAIRTVGEVDTQTFISDICNALREQDALQPNDEHRLRERLERLLNIERLQIGAKASILRTEHERLFCSARILTDARPVYGEDVTKAPVGMVITHELKLTYHEGPKGALQDLYIGLNSKEIGELQEQLRRAEDKAKSLREALRPSQIRFIDQNSTR